MASNYFSYEARQQRRGVKNFRNCALKSDKGFLHVGSGRLAVAELSDCPTLSDKEMGPIQVTEYIDYRGPEKPLRVAQGQLEKFCGSSVCADCVYVGMETPVQVNLHRTEQAETALQAIEAQKAVLLAEAELNGMIQARQIPHANQRPPLA